MADVLDPERVRRYVEEQLALHPWLPRPKHILVIGDKVYYDDVARGVRVYFAGLQPGWRQDTVILVWPSLRPDTLVHEIIHTLGLGETAAWTLAPILTRLRMQYGSLIKRRTRYEICDGGPGCPFRELHARLGGLLVHLVRSV